MKKILKIFMYVCIFSFMFSANMESVFAETKELNVDINSDYTNAVFYITWENSDKTATVEIQSPDGKKFDSKSTPDNVYEAEGEAIIRVGQPVKGSWNVKVTGDNLGKIEVSVGQLPNSMVIDEFNVTKNGNKLIANYKISDCPENIYVEIFVDTDSEGYDGKKVYGNSGEAQGNIEIDLNSFDSNEYHFYIRVSKDGIFKREYSDSVISYQDTNATEKVKNTIGGKYNDGYYIEWDVEDENEDYKVLVWDEKLNLKHEEIIEGTGFFYKDFDVDEEKVYIAVVYEHKRSLYDKIEVLKTDEFIGNVEFDITENITSHKFVIATVDLEKDSLVEGYLNGELKLDKINESGEYKVSMSDGDNEIIFIITDNKSNKKEFVKEMHVDTVAPALSVSEDINNKTVTKDYIYISGYSEAGATLLLNDKEIKMKKGYFNEKIELSLGKNEIKLVAKDNAGNVAVYSANVKYELSKSSRTELYIITGLSIVLLVTYIIVFVKGIKRKKQK